MFIARRQSYHGNTLGALAVGGNEWRRQPFAPLLIDVARVSACYEYRGRATTRRSDAVHGCLLAELEATHRQAGPERVIGFCAEPVVGATARRDPADARLLPRRARSCATTTASCSSPTR